MWNLFLLDTKFVFILNPRFKEKLIYTSIYCFLDDDNHWRWGLITEIYRGISTCNNSWWYFPQVVVTMQIEEVLVANTGSWSCAHTPQPPSSLSPAWGICVSEIIFSHPQQGNLIATLSILPFLIHLCWWIDDEENVHTPPKNNSC